MTRFMHCFACAMCIALLCAGAAFGTNAYDQLLWVDAKGYIVYATPDGETSLKSFIRYRLVKSKGSDLKPGYFKCQYENVETQIPVDEIRSLKLKYTFKELATLRPDDRYNRVILTRRDGQQFEVWVERDMGYSLADFQYLELKYFNGVSNSYEFGGVTGDALREIHFQ